MSKTQKIICIILGVFIVGLGFSATKYGKIAVNSVTELVKGSPSASDTLVSNMNSSRNLDIYDTTYCRTKDGVKVLILSKHIVSSDIQKEVMSDVATTSFSDLRHHLTAKGKYTITNVVVNKKAFDFYTSTTSLAVNSSEVTVIGKFND